MTDVVLDASAVLAVLQNEAGEDRVWAHLPGAIMSAVNAAEVVAKLVDGGATAADAGESLDRLGVRLLPFEAVDVLPSADLRRASRDLSLGDRACLALADRLSVAAVTGDRLWADLEIGTEVQLIR